MPLAGVGQRVLLGWLPCPCGFRTAGLAGFWHRLRGGLICRREGFEPDSNTFSDRQVTDSENNSVPGDPQNPQAVTAEAALGPVPAQERTHSPGCLLALLILRSQLSKPCVGAANSRSDRCSECVAGSECWRSLH
jgi:hypothetical protein